MPAGLRNQHIVNHIGQPLGGHVVVRRRQRTQHGARPGRMRRRARGRHFRRRRRGACLAPIGQGVGLDRLALWLCGPIDSGRLLSDLARQHAHQVDGCDVPASGNVFNGSVMITPATAFGAGFALAIGFPERFFRLGSLVKGVLRLALATMIGRGAVYRRLPKSSR